MYGQTWRAYQLLLTNYRRVLAHMRDCNLDAMYGPLLAFLAASAAAPGVLAEGIVADGQTQTQVQRTGNTVDVRTSTLVGANAFNSFRTFNVAAGETANLHVPDAANNLINLVGGSRSTIDGTLNAYKNGQIGGNVYFANPFGLIVGAKGSVNAGSFHASTPTKLFVDGFFRDGRPDSASIDQLLAGTTPVSAEGLIRIMGQINALNGVSLSGHTVEVSGTVDGGRPSDKLRFLAEAINLKGLQAGARLVPCEGGVEIVAEEDASITGSVTARGTETKGGAVRVDAGRDVHLGQGAKIDASGTHENASGGTVRVMAQRNADIAKGAEIKAAGSGKGNGGEIEFSAMKQVGLDGGTFNARGGALGRGGSVLIDPTDLVVSAFDYHPNDGSSLTLQATRMITVNDGVVISTRQVANDTVAGHQTGNSIGDSGSLTIDAPIISIGRNAQLLSYSTGAWNAGSIALTATSNAEATVGAGSIASITIADGALLDARARGTGGSGDVSLTATGRPSVSIFGFQKAEAIITVNAATLKGANVSAQSSVTIDNKWRYDSSVNSGDATNGLTSFLTSTVPEFIASILGLQVTINAAEARSEVNINSGARLDASADVKLEARTEVTTGFGDGISGVNDGVNSLKDSYKDNPNLAKYAPPDVPVGVGFGITHAKTSAAVNVASGSTIKAKNLDARAINKTTLELEVASTHETQDGQSTAAPDGSSGNEIAVSLGLMFGEVKSSAVIARGATLDISGDVAVAAVTEGSYSLSTEASVLPKDSDNAGGEGVTPIGVVLSYAQINSSANAEMNADLSGAQSLSVVALNNLEANSIQASASVGQTRTDAALGNISDSFKTASPVFDLTQTEGASASENPIAFISGLFGTVTGVIEKVKSVAEPVGIQESKFALAGAVAYAKGDHSATAKIGDNARIRVNKNAAGEGGHVVVAAKVVDSALSNTASAVGVGKAAKDGSAETNTSATTFTAAVGAGTYKHNAQAIIGADVEITANKVGVVSGVDMPIKVSAPAWDFSSWNSFKDSVSVDSITGLTEFANGKASASSTAEKQSFGASVSALDIQSSSFSEVRKGAKIHLNESGAPQAWTADVLKDISDADSAETFSFGAQADIYAANDRTLIVQGGHISTSSQSPKSVGATLSITQLKSSAQALLREGVVVDQVSETIDASGAVTATTALTNGDATLAVHSDNRNRLVSFSAQGGQGGNVGINGAIVLGFMDNTTVASIDNEASVRLGKLDVKANDTSYAWIVAGAFNMSSGEKGSASVGVGVAYNHYGSDTRAQIADNDTMDEADGTDRVSALSNAGGTYKIKDVSVQATNSGRMGTLSIAGAVAKTGGQDSNADKGLFDKMDDKFTGATDMVNQILGKSKPGKAPAKQGGGSTDFSFGFAGAGSASVADSDIQAQAVIDGITLDQGGWSAPATLAVEAVNKTDVITGSGGASLVIGKSSGSSGNVALAGAVAVNILGNGAQAAIRNSTVTGAGDVDVYAIRGGQLVSMGIGIAANTSNQQGQSNITGAGSVSVTLTKHDDAGNTLNKAKASVESSTITGANAAQASLAVAAYNRSLAGTGAGAATIGGNRSAGAAVTYNHLESETSALIADSTVSGVGSVAVQALNASQIISAGAMAQVSWSNDGLAIGGAVVVAEIDSETYAGIKRSNISSSGPVSVLAKDSDRDTAFEAKLNSSDEAIDYDFSGQAAQQDNGSTTPYTGNAITAVAGVVQINLGQSSNNVGASVVYTRIRDSVKSEIDASRIVTNGALTVDASSTARITALAIGAGASGRFAGGGSIAIAEIDNAVKSSVTGSSGTLASGAARLISADSLRVTARDTSRIDTLAGQIQVSFNGGAAVGGAITYNAIDNEASAQVADSVVNVNSANVEASNDSRIRSLAAAGAIAAGGGNGVSLAGSASANFIFNTTTASLRGVTLTAAAGGNNAVVVRAKDDSEIQSLSGAVAISTGAAGVGFAISVNEIGGTTKAFIDDSVVTGAETLTVEAQTDASIKSAAASLSASDKFALSGSAAYNQIANETKANIDRSDILSNSGRARRDTSVDIRAKDVSSIETLSGAIAVGFSQAGVGLAISVNRMDNTVEAGVTGKKAQGHLVNNESVTAESDGSVDVVAVSGGVGGNVGVAGSTAVNLMSNDTKAHVSNSATVLADNNVGVIAQTHDRISVIAGAVGVGVGAAGIGVSVTVNQIGGSTQAVIDHATVDALALDANNALTVRNGDLTSNFDLSDPYRRTQQSNDGPLGFLMPDLAARQGTESVRGVAVNASATHAVGVVSVNVGVGQYVGIAGTANANLIQGNTSALVNASTINRSASGADGAQQLSVKASDHSYANSFVGSIGGGIAGLGLSANADVFGGMTSAKVSTSDIGAKNRTDIGARSTQSVSSLAIGSAVGGLALSGSVAVATFNSTTEAFLEGGSVTGSGLNIDARHRSGVFHGVGAISAGVAGAGGLGVSVTLDQSVTRAHADNSAIDTTGDVSVNAETLTTLGGVSVAGALSAGTAIAGNVSVAMTKNTTEAYITGGRIGTDAQRAGNLSVTAKDRVEIDAKGGALGIGNFGLAASAVVIKSENTTRARLLDTNARLNGGLTVNALSERQLTATSVSAGGGAAGLSGSVAVILSGLGASADANAELDKGGDGTLTKVDSLGGESHISADNTNLRKTDGSIAANSESVLTAEEISAINGAATVQTKSRVQTASATETSARVVGSSVSVGGDVSVKATENNAISARAGGAAVGAVAGAGASVAVAELKTDVVAQVDGASTITSRTAGKTIEVSANAGNLGGANAVDALAIQFAGGFVGVGAAVSVANAETNLSAQVDAGASLSASQIKINANNAQSLRSESFGATVGAVGIGVVTANTMKRGSANAVLGSLDASASSGAVASGFDTLTIGVTSSGAVSAKTTAGVGGVVAGSGAGSDAKDEVSLAAKIGNQSRATANANSTNGDVTVTATAKSDVKAEAFGVGVAYVAQMGVSVANATASNRVYAGTGSGVSITADQLDIAAKTLVGDSGYSAYANAVAGGGALYGSINAASANARNTSSIEASMVGGTVAVNGLGVKGQYAGRENAVATGVSIGGLLAVGAAVSEATSDVSVAAKIDDAVSGTIRDTLQVLATTDSENYADSTAGAGGLIAGAGAGATTRGTSRVGAELGSTQGLLAGTVRVNANGLEKTNGKVSTINASLVGASGGTASNAVNAAVTAKIRDNARITGRAIEVAASNTVRKADIGVNANAGAGGIFGGAAAYSATSITMDTNALIGQGATVSQTDAEQKTVVSAQNILYARDASNLDTGGAIAVALAESKISATMSATANIGANAAVTSKGEVDVLSRAAADVGTHATSRTYGLAGVALGEAYISVDSNNTASLSAGANILSDNDVVIAAGRNASGDTNEFKLNAYTDLYNNTAFPIVTVPTADAILARNRNMVDVDGTIRTIRDAYLQANDGQVELHGYGIGRDLYKEALARIGSFFTGQQVTIATYGGNVYNRQSVSGVSVDGAVYTGIRNKQRITLNEANGQVTTSRQDEGVTYSLTTRNQAGILQEHYNYYSNLITLYANDPATKAGYEAMRDQVAREMSYLGLTPGSNQTYAVNYIDLGDISARGGDIHVEGKFLIGSGVLSAPGDAQISVINNTTRDLLTAKLRVEDEGGHIYFNGANATNLTDISARNDAITLAKAGGGAAEFSSIVTSTNTDAPTILVQNTWTPTGNGRAPDLRVAGQVYNQRGEVSLLNASGNVIVGALNAGDTAQSFTAGKINISAGRDFIYNTPDKLYNSAGNPRGQWASDADRTESERNGHTSGGSPGSLSSGIRAGGDIFISARYLNINGLIQSGVSDWNAKLRAEDTVGSQTVAQRIDQIRAQWLADGSPAGRLYTIQAKDIATGTIASWYDPSAGKIVLDRVINEGGHIVLAGNIISTGNGRVMATNGYANITVNSTTQNDLELRGITNNSVEGSITFLDKLRNQETYYYFNSGYTKWWTKNLGAANWTDSGYATGGNAASYQIAQGARYHWTAGNNLTDTDVSTHRHYSYRIAATWYSGHDRDYTTPTTTTRTSTQEIEGGQYVSLDGAGRPNFESRYTKTYTSDSTSTSQGENTWYTSEASNTQQWYYQDTTTTRTRSGRETYDYSVKADYGVAVEFRNNTSGAVNISSAKNVLLAGGVVSGNTRAGGSVTTTITAGQSILDNTTNVGITSGIIVLSAGDSVGTATKAVTLNSTEAWSAYQSGVTVTAARGDVNLRSNSGDFSIKSITANGNVTIDAEKNICGDYNNTGVNDTVISSANGRISLTSRQGGIGDGYGRTTLNIQTNAAGNKDANYVVLNAQNDIRVAQANGNLFVREAKSAAGDVDLEAKNGAILDANPSETRDERSEQELLASWRANHLLSEADAGSRDQSSLMSEEATVKAYENQKTAEYFAYWHKRNVRAQYDAAGNITGYATDAAPAAYELTDLDRSMFAADSAKWTAAAQADYVAQKNAQYAAFGSMPYDADYRYVATQTEKSDRVTGSTWTLSQLRNTITNSMANKTVTNTQTAIEEPNIIGRNVTLKASTDIGGTDGVQTIDIAAQTGADGSLNLTEAQRIALASAEYGDVVVDEVARTITFAKRDSVDLSATGNVKATAVSGHVWLASREDIKLERIEAGQDVSIKTTQNILDASGTAADAPTVVSGGSVVLEAAYGSVGTADQAIKLQIGGDGVLDARASEAVYVKAVAGDLRVHDVFVRNGTASLAAVGNIIDAHSGTDSTLVAVRARDIILNAGGSIHGRDGEASAFQLTQDVDGTLATVSGGDTRIGSLTSALDYTSANAGGLLAVDVAGGALDIGSFDADSVAVDAHGNAINMAAASYVRTAGSVALSGQSLTMADGAEIASNNGTIAVNVADDLVVGFIKTGNATADAIRLTATNGRILDADNNQGADLHASAPGAVVTLNAGGGIGNATRADGASAWDATVANAIEIEAAKVDATSSAGAIALNSPNAPLNVGTVSGTSVNLTATAITADAVTATAGDIALTATAGDIRTRAQTATGSVVNRATGSITTGNISGSSVTLDGATVTAGDVAATAGDIALTATAGDIRTGAQTATGSVMNTATGAIQVASATAGGGMALTAGTTVQADLLVANGNIQVVAGDGFTVARVQTGSILDVRLTNVGANLDIAQGAAAGGVRFRNTTDAFWVSPRSDLTVVYQPEGGANQVRTGNLQQFYLKAGKPAGGNFLSTNLYGNEILPLPIAPVVPGTPLTPQVPQTPEVPVATVPMERNPFSPMREMEPVATINQVEQAQVARQPKSGGDIPVTAKVQVADEIGKEIDSDMPMIGTPMIHAKPLLDVLSMRPSGIVVQGPAEEEDKQEMDGDAGVVIHSLISRASNP